MSEFSRSICISITLSQELTLHCWRDSAAQLLLVHDCGGLGLKFSLQYCTEMEATDADVGLFSVLPSRWKEGFESFVEKYVASSLSELKINQ